MNTAGKRPPEGGKKMNNISEIPALMIEMFDTCPNYNLTPRGIEIINEIADYAEQTEMFKMNESRGEIFEGKPSKFIFEYMLDRVVRAPSMLHVNASIILIMPFVRKRLNEEMAGEKDEM